MSTGATLAPVDEIRRPEFAIGADQNPGHAARFPREPHFSCHRGVDTARTRRPPTWRASVHSRRQHAQLPRMEEIDHE
jgi:hypothetical protein